MSGNSPVRIGRVVVYFVERGYGFIETLNPENTSEPTRVYVNDSQITGQCHNAVWKSLGEGELVEFKLAGKYHRILGPTVHAIDVCGVNGRRLRGSPYVSRVKGGTNQRQDPFPTAPQRRFNNEHGIPSSHPRPAFAPRNTRRFDTRPFDTRNQKEHVNDLCSMPQAQKKWYQVSGVNRSNDNKEVEKMQPSNLATESKTKKQRRKKNKGGSLGQGSQPISEKLPENDSNSKEIQNKNTNKIEQPFRAAKPKPMNPRPNANWKSKVKQAPLPQLEEVIGILEKKPEPRQIFTSDLGGSTFHSICQLRPIEDLYKISSKAKEEKNLLEIEARETVAESLDKTNVVKVVPVSKENVAENLLLAIESPTTSEVVKSIETAVKEVKFIEPAEEVKPIESNAEDAKPLGTTADEVKVIETAADETKQLGTTAEVVKPIESAGKEGKVIEINAEEAKPLGTTAEEVKPFGTTSDEVKFIETAATGVEFNKTAVEKVTFIEAAKEVKPIEAAADVVKSMETTAEEVKPLGTTATEVKFIEATVKEIKSIELAEEVKPIETTAEEVKPLGTTSDEVKFIQTAATGVEVNKTAVEEVTSIEAAKEVKPIETTAEEVKPFGPTTTEVKFIETTVKEVKSIEVAVEVKPIETTAEEVKPLGTTSDEVKFIETAATGVEFNKTAVEEVKSIEAAKEVKSMETTAEEVKPIETAVECS